MKRYVKITSLLASKSISLLAVFIYARMLTKAEVGQWSSIIATYYLLIPFVSLQIHTAIFRYGADDDYKNTINSLRILSIVLALLGVVLFGCNIYLELNFSFINSLSLCLVAIFFQGNLELIRASAKESYFYYISFTQIVIVFALALLFIKYNFGINGIFFAEIISSISIIIFLMGKCILPKIEINTFNFSHLPQLLKYSLPLIPNALLWWAVSMGAILISNYYLGAESAAIVNINMKIATVLSSLGYVLSITSQRKLITAFNLSFLAYKAELIDYITKSFIGLLLVGILSFFSFTFILEEYYKEYFLDISTIVIVSFIGFFYALTSVLGVMYVVEKKTSRALKSVFFGSTLSVLLMTALAEKYGITGVFLGLLLGFVVIVLIRINDLYYLVYKRSEC